MLMGNIGDVAGSNSSLFDDYRDLCFESEGRGVSIWHQGAVGTWLKNGRNIARSRTELDIPFAELHFRIAGSGPP